MATDQKYGRSAPSSHGSQASPAGMKIIAGQTNERRKKEAVPAKVRAAVGADS